MARTALYEAANVLLSRVTRFSALKRWGIDVAKRRGMKRAKIALAGIDGVDGPTSTASECPGVAAGAPQKREAVREGVYQNRR